jgi:hypothetical protein
MLTRTNMRKTGVAYACGLIVAVFAGCSSSKQHPSATGQAGQSSSTNPSTGSGGTIAQGQSGVGASGASQIAVAGRMSAAATGGNGALTAGSTAAPTAGAAAHVVAGASGTSGVSGTAGASGTAGMTAAGMMSNAGAGGGTMDVACNPADKTADATPVEFAVPTEGQPTVTPTGPYKPVMESDPGIATHTIIRPEPLGEIKHPILAWGEGGCRKSGNEAQNTNLFKEFASHGILIIADGPAGTGASMAGQDGGPLLFALDWARKENARPCSKYYHKLAVDKVAVSGQSCGGIMAFDAAVDPKITTVFLYDSGLFSRDPTIYNALHAPMAIFNGGSQDIAYANGMADFNAIDKIPILFANPTKCSSNAHVCTFFEPSAGQFGRAGVAWMRWHLLDDQGATGKGMFIGDKCGLCGTDWTLQWKKAPM